MIIAICPKCEKVAANPKQIQELFGYRRITDAYVINQSWCKECRQKQIEERQYTHLKGHRHTAW